MNVYKVPGRDRHIVLNRVAAVEVVAVEARTVVRAAVAGDWIVVASCDSRTEAHKIEGELVAALREASARIVMDEP